PAGDLAIQHLEGGDFRRHLPAGGYARWQRFEECEHSAEHGALGGAALAKERAGANSLPAVQQGAPFEGLGHTPARDGERHPRHDVVLA
ncbi:MAG: hypothetical protein ACK559_16230, partial [bacterium]